MMDSFKHNPQPLLVREANVKGHFIITLPPELDGVFFSIGELCNSPLKKLKIKTLSNCEGVFYEGNNERILFSWGKDFQRVKPAKFQVYFENGCG